MQDNEPVQAILPFGNPVSSPLSSPFDKLRHFHNGVECWYGREMKSPQGYTLWQNFKSVILEAMIACKSNGHNVEDHFIAVDKPITSGKGRTQNVTDYRLSRLGCYLVAMGGDGRKPEVAAARNYFATETRKSELAAAGHPVDATQQAMAASLSAIALAIRELASVISDQRAALADIGKRTDRVERAIDRTNKVQAKAANANPVRALDVLPSPIRNPRGRKNRKLASANPTTIQQDISFYKSGLYRVDFSREAGRTLADLASRDVFNGVGWLTWAQDTIKENQENRQEFLASFNVFIADPQIAAKMSAYRDKVAKKAKKA